jgi:subtilisin family serine protease
MVDTGQFLHAEGHDMSEQESISVWLEARITRILDPERPCNVLLGPDYLYRPEQVLVHNEDLPLVERQLKALRATIREDLTEDLAEQGIPITVFIVRTAPVPSVVDRLLAHRDPDDPAPRVAPNHVLVGEPRYMGGPGGEPRPATRGTEPDPERGSDGPVVGALDTGVPRGLGGLHPSLAARLVTEDPDIDALYTTGDLLDHEAGHGTFVSGVIMQLAPWLQIDPEKVLDSAGFGDDVTVTLGLARANRALVNASFGGYTHADRPPLALEAFLAKRDPESVIVAAAGNAGSSRPFWPAAFKHVIAVGAVDTKGEGLLPASFSNHGDWVDCCAPGVDIRSTYVKGEWQLANSGVLEAFDGWACWSGTSFAAPSVVATIAAAMQGNALTPRQAAHGVLAGATRFVPGLGFYVEPAADLVCRDC